MRNPSLRIFPPAVLAAVFAASTAALAHTGGPLDGDGCHADHRTGTYHCHRGAAAGYTFPNRDAMLEAVRTGNFPVKSVDEDGFFSRLWPFGKHHDEEAPAAPAGAEPGSASAATGKTPADAGAPANAAEDRPIPAASAAAAGTVPAKQQEFEQRLKVLQGLYEMGLITKDEYEAKRRAVLDQL